MRKPDLETQNPMVKGRDRKGSYSKTRKTNNKRGRNPRKVVACNDKDYDVTKSPTNDPKWYGAENLKSSSANLFFTKPFGSVLDQFDAATWNEAADVPKDPMAAAGIMVLDIVPSFGSAFGQNDIAPLNVTSQAIYSYVRHANSGSRNYDAPDLMTYLLAMAEVYSGITWLKRIYSTINRYYPENRYFAKQVVSAMNADFDSFMGSMANFAFYINVLISKASAFAIPNTMYYFTRRDSIYGNIYIEDETIKDQLYMFNPKGFYFYTIDDQHPEAYLKYRPLPATLNMSNMMTYFNEMVQNLLDSEDIGIASGDIIKAYGDKLLRLAPFPQDAMIQPIVHDYNVLFQIRNAVVVDSFTPSDLYQDDAKQYFKWENTCVWNAAAIAAKHYRKEILTSNSATPTVDEVLESTRLIATIANYENDGTNWVGSLICGIEVVTGIRMLRFKSSNTSGTSSVYNLGSSFLTVSGSAFVISLLSVLSQFKYHPTVYLQLITNGKLVALEPFQDLDNVVLVDQDTLANVHQTALMSMLAVPAIAML